MLLDLHVWTSPHDAGAWHVIQHIWMKLVVEACVMRVNLVVRNYKMLSRLSSMWLHVIVRTDCQWNRLDCCSKSALMLLPLSSITTGAVVCSFQTYYVLEIHLDDVRKVGDVMVTSATRPSSLLMHHWKAQTSSTLSSRIVPWWQCEVVTIPFDGSCILLLYSICYNNDTRRSPKQTLLFYVHRQHSPNFHCNYTITIESIRIVVNRS
jgi:hypothetical protein